MSSSSTVSLLREALDSVDARRIAQKHLPGGMRSGGRLRFKACPACDKTKSSSDCFSVDRRGFRCFRCGAHGGILALLRLFGFSESGARDEVIEIAGFGGRVVTPAEAVARRWKGIHEDAAEAERDNIVRTLGCLRVGIASKIRTLNHRAHWRREFGGLDGHDTLAQIERRIRLLERLDDLFYVQMDRLQRLSRADCLSLKQKVDLKP